MPRAKSTLSVGCSDVPSFQNFSGTNGPIESSNEVKKVHGDLRALMNNFKRHTSEKSKSASSYEFISACPDLFAGRPCDLHRILICPKKKKHSVNVDLMVTS